MFIANLTACTSAALRSKVQTADKVPQTSIAPVKSLRNATKENVFSRVIG